MPSPIAHTTMGYVVYRVFREHQIRRKAESVGPMPVPLIVAVLLSLMPDVDSVWGLVAGDLDRFHNNISHSLGVGLLVALAAGTIAWAVLRSGFRQWFVLTLVCYELHIIMDYFTIGRGVMALWPISPERYAAPISLFYGLHRSAGWVSARHVWTLVSELAFAALVAAVFHVVRRIGTLRA